MASVFAGAFGYGLNDEAFGYGLNDETFDYGVNDEADSLHASWGDARKVDPMCFNATSSLLAGGGAYGVAAILLRRDHPRLKWGAVALMGITAMQWVEGVLWLDGPKPHGTLNQFLTIALIPLALLAQAWGPLLGSAFDRPVRGRRLPFFLLLILGLTFAGFDRSFQSLQMCLVWTTL